MLLFRSIVHFRAGDYGREEDPADKPAPAVCPACLAASDSLDFSLPKRYFSQPGRISRSLREFTVSTVDGTARSGRRCGRGVRQNAPHPSGLVRVRACPRALGNDRLPHGVLQPFREPSGARTRRSPALRPPVRRNPTVPATARILLSRSRLAPGRSLAAAGQVPGGKAADRDGAEVAVPRSAGGRSEIRSEDRPGYSDRLPGSLDRRHRDRGDARQTP